MTDYLSRQPFIKLLKNIIENQSKNNNGYSIAIDGDWGSGKTWILDALESQLPNDEYLIFHYNAWENDFYEEPLVALLSVMIEKLNEVAKQKSLYESVVTELLKEAASDLEILAVGIAKYFIKIDIDKSIKNKKNLFNRIKQGTKIANDIDSMLPLRKTLAEIREVIKNLAEKLKILLVVDELDRCLPEYAIKVLERLHHVCNKMPVFQIIAIDKSNLADCVFESAGKSVLIYNEGTLAIGVNKFNNCKFVASQKGAGKAAIEIDQRFTNYEVEINGCTATGFDNGSVSGNSLWNNKKGIVAGKTLVVKVDGVMQTLK